jgi:hypothetical protein
MFAEPPFKRGLRGLQPRLNKWPPSPGPDVQDKFKMHKMLKMSKLPAPPPQRGPLNVKTPIETPKVTSVMCGL